MRKKRLRRSRSMNWNESRFSACLRRWAGTKQKPVSCWESAARLFTANSNATRFLKINGAKKFQSDPIVINLDAGSSSTATLYPEPLRVGWRRGFAATKSEAQLLSTVRIFSRPIRSGFAKVEKTAQPRVAVILETKGRNLRFSELLPPRPGANSKKMNS